MIPAAEPADNRSRRAVALWLFVMCGLVFAMVMVGGLTRLTDSGLSITEWKPVTGALPPLNAGDWAAAFEKYRQIPEYRLINDGMSLAEFKRIYWWEWGHRLLGRLIGLAFLVPFIWFLVTRRIGRALAPKLAGLFVLGGLQGVLGWYMVMSGLVHRVDVSQYRLAAHLGLAVALYGALFWVALDLWRAGGAARQWSELGPELGAGWALAGLIYLQIILGAFVAGLDAGLAYNSWPLMDGAVVPGQLFGQAPWWLNFFENPKTVQFVHRSMAYLVVAAVLAHWWRVRGRAVGASAALLAAAVLAQAALGIWTLLAAVPIVLGAAHQAGALVVLTAALYHVHEMSARRA